jgi:hypothetical protein
MPKSEAEGSDFNSAVLAIIEAGSLIGTAMNTASRSSSTGQPRPLGHSASAASRTSHERLKFNQKGKAKCKLN